MSASAGLDASRAKPVSDRDLTPAQRAMDARDWVFGGTWPYGPRWHWAEGVRLHYVDEGPADGDTVVMVHGCPTWSFLYRGLIASLVATGQRAIALDHLGFGRSDKPHRQREYSLERHSRLFESFVDHLGVPEVTLVVHDWGGPIALPWAVRNPQRLKALVICNTFPDPVKDGPSASAILERLPGSGELLLKGANRSLHRAVHSDATGRDLSSEERRAYEAPHPSWDSRTGILALARASSGSRRAAARAVANTIKAGLPDVRRKPALIAWGMEDQLLSPALLSQWSADLPHAQVMELDGVGHLVPHAESPPLAAAISDLARGVGRR